ncbi:MAG: single-stranded-DNA-specific exonuclease RecJ [Nitrospinota bacterium]|nr:single-stranded-DNA-specific exonuclease RecJ [Nitrospinota bacterium]
MTWSGKSWTMVPDNADARESIGEALGLEPLICRLLANRGITTPEEAELFLNPSLDSISSPYDIPSMDRAAQRVALARQRGEKVAVYGDFDVDGLTGGAMLHRFLEESGIDSQVVASRRESATRGLTMEEVEKMKRDGAALVITVDTGSSAVDAARRAGELGLDMLITDHHLPSGQRPQALAEVNPHFCAQDAACRDLSGVGVAFKLAMAARKVMRDDMGAGREPNLKRLMGLVAMGTVADCSPLLGENRTMVRHGLDELSSCSWSTPGLKALKNVCRLNGRDVTSRDISFEMAPRLNSASRMNNVETAMELLTTMDAHRAAGLAARLDTDNNRRKRIQSQILAQASQMAQNLPERETRVALVLRGEEWNPGVIGIVASRLVDEWRVPVVMVCFSGGMGKGSCRSIPSFDIYAALMASGDALERFGGHKTAAGLYVQESQFDTFKEAFLHAAEAAMGAKGHGRSLICDMELEPAAVTEETVGRIAMLEPFGDSAEAPLFLARGQMLAAPPELIGEDGRSAKFRISGAGGASQAVAFGMGDYFHGLDWESRKVDIVYTPEINRWGARQRLQLRIVDIKESERK